MAVVELNGQSIVMEDLQFDVVSVETVKPSQSSETKTDHDPDEDDKYDKTDPDFVPSLPKKKGRGGGKTPASKTKPVKRANTERESDENVEKFKRRKSESNPRPDQKKRPVLPVQQNSAPQNPKPSTPGSQSNPRQKAATAINTGKPSQVEALRRNSPSSPTPARVSPAPAGRQQGGRGNGQVRQSAQQTGQPGTPRPQAPGPGSLRQGSGITITEQWHRPAKLLKEPEIKVVKTIPGQQTKKKREVSPEIKILEYNNAITRNLGSKVKVTPIPAAGPPGPGPASKSVSAKSASKVSVQSVKIPSKVEAEVEALKMTTKLPSSTKVKFTAAPAAPSISKPPGPPGPPGPARQQTAAPPVARQQTVIRSPAPACRQQTAARPPPGPPARQQTAPASRPSGPPGPPGPAATASKPRQQPAQKQAKNPEEIHFCDQCGSTFKTKSILDTHIIQKHKVKCSICAQYFDTEKEQEDHQDATHKIVCTEEHCTFVCYESYNLEKHTKDDHTKSCFKCDETFVGQVLFDKHIKAAHNFKCDKWDDLVQNQCNSVHDSKAQLRSHIEASHTFPCNFCSFEAGGRVEVERHEAEKHSSCPDCEDEFSWVEAGHKCYYTVTRTGPKTDRVVKQNVYFPTCTYYFI